MKIEMEGFSNNTIINLNLKKFKEKKSTKKGPRSKKKQSLEDKHLLLTAKMNFKDLEAESSSLFYLVECEYHHMSMEVVLYCPIIFLNNTS